MSEILTTWVRSEDSEPGTRETAVGELDRILDAALAHDGLPAVSDQARVAARLGNRAVLLAARADKTVAVGILGEGELDLVVEPSHRGNGVGSTAFRALLADHQAPATGDLRAWVHGDQPAAEHLLETHGFHAARTLIKMALDPAKLPEPLSSDAWETTPPTINGFSVHRFDLASEVDIADVVAVNAAAFVDHPEQGQLTREGFLALTREPWFRAEHLVLAREAPVGSATSRRLAGFSWIKVTHDSAGAATAELYVLGVHPDFGGKGLGRALLNIAMQQMAAEKPAEVSLYVEASNTPALALYERAGFSVATTSKQWIV